MNSPIANVVDTNYTSVAKMRQQRLPARRCTSVCMSACVAGSGTSVGG